jgi:cytosine/uracil/thiamine/allantoin permease
MEEAEIVELEEDISSFSLYSEDLAPVPKAKRTWSVWSLTALWVGMAVCIPTYLLASYMIKSGMGWLESLIIIGAANLIITIPMVLNGHAGVKYGIPFPVVGRSSFGTKGVQIPSLTRAIVACGWFGIQTWIGGLAIYAILAVVMGFDATTDLTIGTFICFVLFWFLNMFFIWKGTESIKWLEEYSAPILILIGFILIGWGAYTAGGFGTVLDQGEQLRNPSSELKVEGGETYLHVKPLKTKEGNYKADEILLICKSGICETDISDLSENWVKIDHENGNYLREITAPEKLLPGELQFQLRNSENPEIISSKVDVPLLNSDESAPSKIWSYIFWLTIMLGFWATMSLSIADVTRYAPTQKTQVKGQFYGLPGTMMLFSFVAIFVTCAAVINFDSILISDDAPWDPVSLLARFDSPLVVIVAQIFLIIATLSTNIAANVIAPANAFANLIPKKLTFKSGGTITGIIGILICPWWLMDDISDLLIFVSGLLGPVLGIMLCDYFLIRKKRLELAELYKSDGLYSYGKSGFNSRAMIALAMGVVLALVWSFLPSLAHLASLAWFTGFISAFALYYMLMANQKTKLS